MIPETVRCEECGKTAVVRGYGRLVYDWDAAGRGPATIKIKCVRLTVDCPKCGVHAQEHWPAEALA